MLILFFPVVGRIRRVVGVAKDVSRILLVIGTFNWLCKHVFNAKVLCNGTVHFDWFFCPYLTTERQIRVESGMPIHLMQNFRTSVHFCKIS